MAPTPTPSEAPAPPPSAYTDAATLAVQLGITRQTLYEHLGKNVPWLPAPTRLAGRWVWLTADLDIDAIREERRLNVRPGNPNWRRKATAPPVDENGWFTEN